MIGYSLVYWKVRYLGNEYIRNALFKGRLGYYLGQYTDINALTHRFHQRYLTNIPVPFIRRQMGHKPLSAPYNL
jgi:hypothetical protein